MANLEDGMEFGPYSQRPCNPQKPYSGGEEYLTVSVKSAKVQSVEFRDLASQFNELTINSISPKSQNVPQSNDAKAASFCGKVSFTTKNAGVESILQMKLLQTPCTQGIVWEKGLNVHDGQYTKGEHFQSVNDNCFSGSFGKGFICVDLKTRKRFFMKQVMWTDFRPSEVLIPICLDHENVTKLYGVIQQDDIVDILMEDAGVSLTDFVMSNPRLEERLVLELTKHALAGLKELHQNNVIHHDIKPDNLCVYTNANGSFTLKLADFGSARSVNQPIGPMNWTPAFLAPEACRKVLQKSYGNRDEQITEKVDVFALGVTHIFMFEKQHVLLHKMTAVGKVSYKDLSAKGKQKLDICLLQYLAAWTEPPQDLFPKECSVKVHHLLAGMLSGSQDLRFSAGEALAFIESNEVIQKEYQQTQNGRLVTHPSDAGEVSTIMDGVINLAKGKWRNRMRKDKKEREVLEGGTDVQAMTETMRQNPNVKTILKTRSGNAVQASESAAGAINPWLGLHHAQQVQVSKKHRKQSILNGVAAQNSTQRHQANFLSRKPEKRKHEDELRQHPGKKMKQSVSGDSTPFVSAQPGPAIPYSVRGLSKYNMMDGEMKPRMVDDIQPLHKDATKPIGKECHG